MAMSSVLHINEDKALLEVYQLPECQANVLKIEDETFNQVVVFLTLEQVEELANKLKEYVESQGGNN